MRPQEVLPARREPAGSTNYTVPPTPAELANHLADALEWTSSHLTTATPARTVLIYAWNENDEGGWLVPTLNLDGSTNAERLTAIAAKLKHETESNPAPGKNPAPSIQQEP